MTVKVAVVGAGALGLMALKNFKEDGFDVTGFETRDYVGGLWKDDSRSNDDDMLSVFQTTRFNSSRYRSAISDYPFPEDADDFPTAPQMHRYLADYAEHFVCRPGHSHIDYHGPEQFKDHNVLIIGSHASAQDVAASLSNTATKVYIPHRKDILLLPRYSEEGIVSDAAATLQLLLIQTFMSTWIPRLWDWLIDKMLASVSAKAFTIKPEWNFSPASSMTVATPLIADEMYKLLQSGFATPVKGVQAITGPRSVVLTDGTELHDIDSIIQCTGYDFAVPCLPPSSPYQPYPRPGETPYFYRNIFPLHEDPQVRNSIAFLGQAAIAFPDFVALELVAQAISRIWRGRSTLPPLAEMKQWHATNSTWRQQMTKQHGISSTFYVAFVPFSDHICWIDETAGSGVFRQFDRAWFNWRSWSLSWKDRELYRTCLGGLFSPAVWRLFECGGRKSWDGARRQVLRDDWAAIGKVKAKREVERARGRVDVKKLV